MSILFRNGLLHDGINEEAQQCDIRVEDGRFAAIGSNLRATRPGTEVIDLKGKHIYPGLVEAHGHLGLQGYGMRYEGADINEKNDPITPQLRAIDAFNPQDLSIGMAAQAGVTTVGTGPGSGNVVGGTFIAIKTTGRRVDDMIIKNPVAMKCAFGENPKFGYQEKQLCTRMTIAAKLRELLYKTQEYDCKLKAAGEDLSKKPAFDLKLEAMLPVIRKQIPLKAHAHQANDICTAIRIAKEFDLLLTLEHCTEAQLIVPELVEAGWPLAIGPSLTHAGKVETRQRSFETPGILAAAGCEVSIITDSPVTPQPYLALLAGLAVKSGMAPFAALQAITINPAKLLGVEKRVGSIEPGKDADLLIANGDILAIDSAISQVYINGQPISMEKTA
ncbi:MAG: amidohydrolase [Oligosphaeraceae bacterium]|nr:amidohydrolase [Oligosphaeraceae bacterium]